MGRQYCASWSAILLCCFFCCCPSGWIYKSSTYRQKAGKLAAGQYWKIGDDLYKQEARETNLVSTVTGIRNDGG